MAEQLPNQASDDGRVTIVQLAISATAAVLFSLASLSWFFAPFMWIFLSWVVVCLHATILAKNTHTKVIAVNAGALLAVLFGFEGFLYAQSAESRRDEVRAQDGTTIKRTARHEILGWAPNKSQVVFWKRYFGDTLLFDVNYEIDDAGLRVSPAAAGAQTSQCILFFGGSFIFGAGVHDKETTPYLVGSRHPESFRVYNFGYSGYGAHQMLAALQHGIVDDIIDCQPRYVIYLAIPGHVLRSANKAHWCKACGPKYTISDNGELTYSGQLKPKTSAAEMTQAALRRSFIISLLANKIRLGGSWLSNVTIGDVELFVTIVDSSRKLIERRYSGTEFHMLLWDGKNWVSKEIENRLRERDLKVHLVSNILPAFFDRRLDYVLSEHDRHPNQRAHKAMAEYISDTIVGK